MTTSPTWRKAEASKSNGSCVEIAHLTDGTTLVRDSKNPHGALLHFTRPEWDAFLDGAKNGEFDTPQEHS